MDDESGESMEEESAARRPAAVPHHGVAARCSAANASSVTLTADVGS